MEYTERSFDRNEDIKIILKEIRKIEVFIISSRKIKRQISKKVNIMIQKKRVELVFVGNMTEILAVGVFC